MCIYKKFERKIYTLFYLNQTSETAIIVCCRVPFHPKNFQHYASARFISRKEEEKKKENAEEGLLKRLPFFILRASRMSDRSRSIE